MWVAPGVDQRVPRNEKDLVVQEMVGALEEGRRPSSSWSVNGDRSQDEAEVAAVALPSDVVDVASVVASFGVS